MQMINDKITTMMKGVCARLSLVLVVALTIASCAQPGTPRKAQSNKRPNIILIVADDLGYADMSVFGSEIPTPNIDSLAKNGMLLTDFYAAMTCSPTRAMLMSGNDNHVAGLGVMGKPTRADQKDQPGYEGHLNFRVASLPALMTDAGYNTYMTGKWHLGETVETGPRARGFKRSFISLDGAAHLGPWDWRGPQNAQYRDGDELVTVGDDWYTTRDYTKKMIDYIDQDRAEGKPFFAWLAYTAPHWPLQAPKESIAKFKGWYDDGYEALYAKRFTRQQQLGLVPKNLQPINNARFSPRWNDLTPEQKKIESRKMEVYAAMVSDLDHYIGEVVAHLKKIGEFDNTLIMFMSDNGAEPGRRDQAPAIANNKAYDQSVDNLGSATSYVMYGPNWASASAAPFNRHKGTGFEGGIHVPAFAHYPGKISRGSKSDAVATIMDVLPTFLDVAGAKPAGNTWRGNAVIPPKGVSLLPVLYGKAAEAHAKDELFGWELFGHRSLRQGDWKLVWDQTAPAAQRRWQLFNLANDPFEQQNLATANLDKFNQMVALWDQYANDNGVIY
jgi:arylsulfatase A-like enzyme